MTQIGYMLASGATEAGTTVANWLKKFGFDLCRLGMYARYLDGGGVSMISLKAREELSAMLVVVVSALAYMSLAQSWQGVHPQ